MTWVSGDGGAKWPAVEFLRRKVENKNAEAVDFRSAFIRTGGPNSEIDLESRTAPTSDLRTELLEGRANVFAKTDCLPWAGAPSLKNAAYYRISPSQLVGNYGNRGSVRPAKYCCRATVKTATGTYGILIAEGLETGVFEGPPDQMGEGLPMAPYWVSGAPGKLF